MLQSAVKKDHLLSYLLIMIFMGLLGLWIKGVDIETGRQQAGVIIFSLGFVMLSAYVLAQIVRFFKLPMLTGYIFAIMVKDSGFGYESIKPVPFDYRQTPGMSGVKSI